MNYKTGLDIPLVVVQRRTESDSCQSVIFELPRNFNYSSGHWMDIRFPQPDLPDVKTFSFASSPTEPQIVISFKNGVSKFKQALSVVQPGDIMRITQYGGDFCFKSCASVIMIAGGIGIAPFRSMIKEALDTNSTASMALIYINNSDNFLFKSELDDWRQRLPNLAIHYINSKVQGRLTNERIEWLVNDIAECEAYIAGPPDMVERVENILLALGLRDYQIHIDSFDGY